MERMGINKCRHIKGWTSTEIYFYFWFFILGCSGLITTGLVPAKRTGLVEILSNNWEYPQYKISLYFRGIHIVYHTE